MPFAPDFGGQFGHGGAGAPSPAAPVIPTIIRNGKAQAKKTTVQQRGQYRRTETTTSTIDAGTISTGEINATPQSDGGRWEVVAQAILPSDVPAGVLRLQLADLADGAAEDKQVGAGICRSNITCISLGSVTALASYTPDAPLGDDLPPLTLITNARRL